MIIKQFVDSFTAFTWCASRRLRVFLFQAAKDSFGFIYTSATSTHVVLLAFLGKALFHSVVRCHQFSTLTASAVRHDCIWPFVPYRCTMWLCERKRARGHRTLSLYSNFKRILHRNVGTGSYDVGGGSMKGFCLLSDGLCV